MENSKFTQDLEKIKADLKELGITPETYPNPALWVLLSIKGKYANIYAQDQAFYINPTDFWKATEGE